MQDQGRRGSSRIKARLKVRFKNAASFVSEYTHNISKGGIYIRTNNPCERQDRVEVILILPESEEEISAFGEVIHVVKQEEGTHEKPAGMGIQLDRMDTDIQVRIEEFINERLESPEQKVIEDRREHKRFKAKLRIRFGSKEALVEEYIRNISHGGIFIATTNPKPIGEKLTIILIHPDSGDEMPMQGEVVRIVTDKEIKDRPKIKPGMGVRFLELDDNTRKILDEFIKSDHVQKQSIEPSE